MIALTATGYARYVHKSVDPSPLLSSVGAVVVAGGLAVARFA